MIKKQIKFFILRWIVSSFLMWICVKLFGRVDREVDTFGVFVTAGFVLSVVQTIVKPILTIFALPLILLTMGIFNLVLNIAMLWLVVHLVPHISISGIQLVWSWLLMSVLTSLVNFVIPDYN